jgi:hydrogenase maturation protease
MEGQQTIVIGLGNPFLGDDGVGVQVARLLDSALRPDHSNSLQITEASVGGIRLMELMVGFKRAILVDALLLDQPLPGRIHRWSLSDLEANSPTQHTACAHDTTLITALAAGKSLGIPLPDEITILAIEVDQVDEFKEGLSYGVSLAADEVAHTLIDELESNSPDEIFVRVNPEKEKAI